MSRRCSLAIGTTTTRFLRHTLYMVHSVRRVSSAVMYTAPVLRVNKAMARQCHASKAVHGPGPYPSTRGRSMLR